MAKILIVEDDNHLREIYELRMQAAGHEVVSAADGEEALKVAIKEKPDLVISDVMMPKISGFDMLDILRSTDETKHAKVIMMTALSQAEDKQRAESLGADRYLVKSQVTLDDVAQVTEEVLSGKPATPSEETAAQPSETPATEQPDTTTQPAPTTDQQPTQGATNPQPVPAPAPATDDATTTPATPVVQQQPQLDDASTAQTATTTSSDDTSSTPQDPQVASTASTQAPQTPPDTTANNPASDPKTIDSEESAIAKQIEGFMHTNNDDATTSTQPPTDTQATNNDAPQTIPGIQSPTTPPSADETPKAPEDTNVEAGSDQQQANDDDSNTPQQPSPSVASDEAPSRKKKVIQPINDLTASKADELEKLLKKEEIRDEMSKVVSDIKTEDIADLSNDNTAEQALKEAQTEFSGTPQTPSDANASTANPDVDDQDIQITKEGQIVPQDKDEAEAAAILKAAQSQPQEPQTTPEAQPQETANVANNISATPPTQTDTATPNAQTQSPPQPPQPVEATTAPTPTTPDPGTTQQQPVIPHTNGTAIDGVISQPAPAPQQPTPSPAQPVQQQPQEQPQAPQPQTPQSQPPQPAENQQPSNTASPNPNDIAL